MVNTINLSEKLAMFAEHWKPRTIGQFNGDDLMVVKVKGEFTWHRHDDTDDFFLVLKGIVAIRMRERTVTLGPGETSQTNVRGCRVALSPDERTSGPAVTREVGVLIGLC